MTATERAAAWAGLRLALVVVVLLALLLWWALSGEQLSRADRALRLEPVNPPSAPSVVPLAGESRLAWHVEVGEELRFSVRVPADDPELRVHHAFLRGLPELAVRVVRGDGTTEEVALLPGSDGQWRRDAVPLPARAGEPLEIALAPLDGRGRPGLGSMLLADVVLTSRGRVVRPEERPVRLRHVASDLLAPRARDRVPAPPTAVTDRVDLPGPAVLELREGQPVTLALDVVPPEARLEAVVRVHPLGPVDTSAPVLLHVRAGGALLDTTSVRELALPGPEGTPAYERRLELDLARFEGEPLELEFALQGGPDVFAGLREVLVTRPHVEPRSVASPPEEALRVVLVLVDGLRADRLALLGHELGHTPNLTALAARGTFWSRVQLPSSWSLPNVATLLTGRSPLVHGVGLASGRQLSPRLGTLAHWAGWAGVSTAVFTSSAAISPATGLDGGFEQRTWMPVSAPVLTEAALDWLASHLPFDTFLVLHLGDLLPPYEAELEDLDAVSRAPRAALLERVRPLDPRPGAAETLAQEIGPHYDASLARVDRALGELVDGLDALGTWERTLLVVVGTAGQEFFEHGGRGAAQTLFDEVTVVPALAVGPGIEALAEPVHEPVALEDLSVLIGRRSGLASAEALPGRLPPPYGPGGTERTFHALLMPHARVTSRRLEASRRGDLLLVNDPLVGRRALYDLAQDPLARTDLLAGADDLVLLTEAEALAEDFERWYRDELAERAAWPVERP